ncbi:LOW QUALITY PROTEIN: hypothetical protein YC2023_114510 [Brassica napus]
MIQSPKPVNPVLHLPQLEANRFNQLQTRHWRPGDHFNQSGDILGVQEEFCKFIPSTSNHWIMRILIYSNLPYLDQTDINVQPLFSLQIRHETRTYKSPRKVPRKLSYPLKPFRFKKNQVSHLEPKSHNRLQRLLSTQIERVNHFDPSFHQIERFNQTFLRKSTSVHHLIKLRVIHIQQLDSILSFISNRTGGQPKALLNQPRRQAEHMCTKHAVSYKPGEFKSRDNFNGLYTQEGVHPIWNQSNIFTEQEVMNFTSQRFSSPSICEYPTLEGDLSSSKEHPEAKPIIGVKRSLSAFQKAQDQEKWSRNYEVMIQSPKPVNPVLHLPQLEANRFNQLQTRHWRPGDHFNQSGDILGVQEEFCKFIPCTSNHWIMRILIYSNLPYLEQTDINLFSLQIRHEIRIYQAPRKVPRKLSYPLKPSRFKKNQVSHLEPKSHNRFQRLVFRFCYFA